MRSLDAGVQALFDKQVGIESRNALAYLNAAFHALRAGNPGFAKRWAKQAGEEFGHASAFTYEAGVLGAGPMYCWPLTLAGVGDTMEGIAEALAEAEAETEAAMGDFIRGSDACPAAAAWVSDRISDQSRESKEAADLAQAVREAVASGTLHILDRSLLED